MKSVSTVLRAAVTAVVTLLCFADFSTSAAVPRFVAKELRFPRATGFRLAGLNDRGDIIGTVDTENSERGFLLMDESVIYFDRFFRAQDTVAVSVNNQRQVVGYALPHLASTPSWFIYSNGAIHDINVLDGYFVLDVADINDRGEFVGHCTDGHSIFTFIFTGGHVALLTQLPPGNRGHPWLRVNNHGEVVAYDDFGGRVLTTNSISDLVFGNTLGINDHGDIIGLGAFDGGEMGFTYSAGVTSPIFGLPERGYTVPTAINERKQVVGYCVGDDTSDSGLRAFLFENNATFDLNQITANQNGFVLINPAAINNSGVIACLGLRGQRYSAFVLRPIGVRETGKP